MIWDKYASISIHGVHFGEKDSENKIKAIYT